MEEKQSLKERIEDLIKRYEEYTKLKNTVSENFKGESSFYLLPSGDFLNKDNRYFTHDIMFKILNNEIIPNDFTTLHDIYKIVRLVPKSKIALVKRGQKINAKQKKSIKEIGFRIEKF